MQFDQIPIYVISLADEKLRKKSLKKQFSIYFDKFKFVDAFDFRRQNLSDIEHLYNKCVSDKKNPLAPTEIGCSLSHIKALNLFLESDYKRCIILEDDIIGSDADIDFVLNVLENEVDGGLFLLGGQEGMKNNKYLCGYKYTKKIYTIPRLARFFLYRTCCYSVDRGWAEKVIKKHSICLRRADDWLQLTESSKDVFFFKALKHPVDLENSYIQNERNLFKDNLTALTYRNILKVYLSILLICGKLKKIK